MKLSRVRVENHARLADLDIEVREDLVLVGANDAGKSSFLRCLDLLLGASTAQLYSRISIDDFRDGTQPFVIEATLTDFTDRDRAFFPYEISIDPDANSAKLVIRLEATMDENETVTIDRRAPDGGTGRQLSRDQIAGLGWKFLSATTQARDLREDRKSPLDDILQAVDLGDDAEVFTAIAERLKEALKSSSTLEKLRSSLAYQLSKALPEEVAQDDLAFVPGATADNDVLSDVRLQVNKHGIARDLSEQSDGTRALYALALYDLVSGGANIVGIDEPEIHLHPSSQRNLARLLKDGANQKVIATHSEHIVGPFDPESIVVVRNGGKLTQPDRDFLSADQRTVVRLWVRDKIEALTAQRVILVEGISDAILLAHLAGLTGRNLDRLGVSLINAEGHRNMGPISKLFTDDGFRVPTSYLIDQDAEVAVAKQLGFEVDQLVHNSVWVSQKDLEDEYVRALGADAVWEACQTRHHFSKNELRNCATSGPNDTPTETDVADFCRKKPDYKIKAVLSILHLFTAENATEVVSIENLLAEIVE